MGSEILIWYLLFWGSLGLVAYVYFGYPLLMWVLASLLGKTVGKKDIAPTVSLIIAAHNEEKVIEEKLENALALDYPAGKLEVIVASDHSVDRTNEIVRGFADRGVILNALPRVGKSVAQNRTVPLATGEIVVFSDANSVFRHDALRKLVRNFADPSVGAVSGKLAIVNEQDSSTSAGEGSYWRYENFLRTQESRLWSCIMANATIFALRRDLYRPIDPGFSEDFVLPLWVAADGRRTVFEPEAICYERTASTPRDEFHMRVRNTHGDSYGLFKLRCMLSPFHPFLAFQVLSHKLLRWSVGYFCVLMLLSNVFLLADPLYQFLLLGQAIFYLAALVGLLLERQGKSSPPFYVPYYFSLTSFALMVGLFKSLIGVRYVTMWETAESFR
ncbi:MAG: glycosyltransferase family 2 protein [Chloroflexi bacterium]|nr:glycosyltransferase family 2 protein [Chloroflexota bacterium]